MNEDAERYIAFLASLGIEAPPTDSQGVTWRKLFYGHGVNWHRAKQGKPAVADGHLDVNEYYDRFSQGKDGEPNRVDLLTGNFHSVTAEDYGRILGIEYPESGG